MNDAELSQASSETAHYQEGTDEPLTLYAVRMVITDKTTGRVMYDTFTSSSALLFGSADDADAYAAKLRDDPEIHGNMVTSTVEVVPLAPLPF